MDTTIQRTVVQYLLTTQLQQYIHVRTSLKTNQTIARYEKYRRVMSCHGWMDGRMDGWMDGWTDGRMDGWIKVKVGGLLWCRHRLLTLVYCHTAISLLGGAVRNHVGVMAALRRDLETARVQDENVSLRQDVHKLSSTMSAHLRFNQRAIREQSAIEKEHMRLLEEIQALNSTVLHLETNLRDEREKRHGVENELHETKRVHEAAIRAYESQFRERERHFADELVAIRDDHEAEYQSITARETPETSQLRHKVLDLEVELENVKNLLQERDLRQRRTQVRLDDALASIEKHRQDLIDNEHEKTDMIREINIKDKQLKLLRDNVEDLRMVANQAGALSSPGRGCGSKEDEDDAIEFMKEEMDAMKKSYEAEVQRLKLIVEDLEKTKRRT